jgi:PTH1 family peptidyl-tRNA hydrolase
MSAPYALVGLGNPGSQYELTRHNVGFLVVDRIAHLLKARFKPGKGRYQIADATCEGRHVLLVKPQTYMNASGEAVVELVHRYQVPLERLLIILDDFQLPLGRIRLRPRGSDGGHNGLASVIYQLRTEEFPRLRVGIGDDIGGDPVAFVLSEFSRDEMQQVPDIVDRAAQAALTFIAEGIDTAMNRFNP